MTRHTRFPTLLAASALLLLASGAQAQSSYSMTTLSAPSSSLGYVATAMDSTGKVVGFQQVRNGSIYASPGDFGALLQCLFGCAAYTAQMVTWPASTGSSVSATRGELYFAALHLNDRGNALGFVVQQTTRKSTVLPFVTPTRAGDYRSLFLGLTTTYLQINGTSNSISGDLYGLLPNNAVYGSEDGYTANDGLPNARLPSVRLNNQVTRTLVPGNFVTGRFTAMNTVGDAAGQVSTTNDGSGWVPMQWQAGVPSLINLPAAYAPISMNDARQVLMQTPAPEGQASVWFNGAATAINGNGKRVFATAMNSSGTVVGCTQNVVSTPKRTDNTAFIWKNGVLQDLTQVLASKGVTLPSGTRLGCPVAINNAGSILAYYYRTTSVDTITWVRLNAKP